jgi:hypothetical protein
LGSGPNAKNTENKKETISKIDFEIVSLGFE